MVTKVALEMLENKVVKNADLTNGVMTLTFSDGTQKQITVTAAPSEGGGDSIVGKSGTLVGVVTMADQTQFDIPVVNSEPYVPTPQLQMAVQVDEPGNYYAIAFVNVCGCHVAAPGETVTATYFGKSWAYNTRFSACAQSIDIDGSAADRVWGADTDVPAGFSTTMSMARLFTDVTAGLHRFRWNITMPANYDRVSYRHASVAVFRV